jgi:PAS domain S-box-containing protein
MKKDLEILLTRDDIPKEVKSIIQRTLSKQQKEMSTDITDRMMIEANLITSEPKFRRLFEDSPISLLEVDFSELKTVIDTLSTKGVLDFHDHFEKNPEELNELLKLVHFISVNKAALIFYGADSIDEFQKSSFKNLRGEQRAVYTSLIFSLLTGHSQFEGETIAYSLKGTPNHVLIRATVVKGFEKSLSKVFVSLTDISALKESELALRESEISFRQLFEDSPASIREFDLSESKKLVDQLKKKGIHDIEGYFKKNPLTLANLSRTVNVNTATLELFEAKSIEELHKHSGTVYGDQAARFRSDFMALYNGQTKLQREGIMYTVKGKKINVFMKISVVPSYEESLSKVYVSTVDITHLKEAENAIKQSERKIRNIIDHSRDGIILISEEGQIAEWNHAIERLTGINSEQAIDRPFWEVYNPIMPAHVFHSESATLIIDRLNDVLQTGKAEWLSSPIETEIVTRLGERKYVQINVFPIKTQSGFMVGSIWRNVTKQKEIETKMRQELLKFNIEDQNLYLVKEADPILSREVLSDLIRIGYSGMIMTRTPEMECKEQFNLDFKYFWLAETIIEKKYSSLFQKMEVVLEALPPKSVVLIERLDYLISKFGFKETLLFIYKLRETAIFLNLVILLSIDDQTVTADQLKLLEKETNEVETRVLAEIPLHLLEILRFIYTNNSNGIQPSYTQVANQLGMSRPTARKRIKNLTAIGYLRENQKGRTKVLELTIRGVNSFTQKSDTID